MDFARRSARIGAAVFSDVEANALQLLRRVEIARPLPDGDRAVDSVVLGGNAHHFRAAPGNRPNIGVGKALLLQQRAAGIVDLGDAVGNVEAEDAGRFVQPLGMFGQLEDLAAIGALAFENSACIMQAVGQHVNLGVRPFDEFAIHPDKAIELVEGNGCHDYLPRGAARTSLCFILPPADGHADGQNFRH